MMMLIAVCKCWNINFKYLPMNDVTLQHNTVIASYKSTSSATDCGYVCSRQQNCSSFSYDDSNDKKGLCVLSAANPVPTIVTSDNLQIYGMYI